MNTINFPRPAFIHRSLWVVALLFGCAFTASARAASPEDRGTLFGAVAVPAGRSAGEVQEAMVATLLGRKWEVQSKSDTQVVGYLKHRSNEATVTLVHAADKIELYWVGYKINKSTGGRVKPSEPTGWLKNLQKDLTKHLNGAGARK